MSPIAPTAVFVDEGSYCPSQLETDYIRNAINNRGLVKCMTIGDGLMTGLMVDPDY